MIECVCVLTPKLCICIPAFCLYACHPLSAEATCWPQCAAYLASWRQQSLPPSPCEEGAPFIPTPSTARCRALDWFIGGILFFFLFILSAIMVVDWFQGALLFNLRFTKELQVRCQVQFPRPSKFKRRRRKEHHRPRETRGKVPCILGALCCTGAGRPGALARSLPFGGRAAPARAPGAPSP